MGYIKQEKSLAATITLRVVENCQTVKQSNNVSKYQKSIIHEDKSAALFFGQPPKFNSDS